MRPNASVEAFHTAALVWPDRLEIIHEEWSRLGVTSDTGYVPTAIAGARRYEIVPWTGGDQAVWG